MTTYAQKFAPKAGVALVAAAMVISMFVPAAKAQTTAELQTMINNLMAQIATLQAQIGQGGNSAAASVCPYTWTRDLTMGSTGADVMKLQQFLNANADTRVAASGAGSAGAETQYFGALTATAVSKFQVMYRSEVLTPSGLINPTGYFGPSSRAKANTLCVTAPVVTPDTGDNDTTTTTPNPSVTLNGEGSLSDVQIRNADDTEITEGSSDVPLGVFKIKANNGDIRITRMDVGLVANGSNRETSPWNTFQTVSLWVNGKKVGEVNADNRSDYLNKDDGSLRFSGLDIVAESDRYTDVTVAATLPATVRGSDQGNQWSLFAGSMRYEDSTNVTTTDSAVGDMKSLSNRSYSDTPNAQFTVNNAGYQDQLVIKSSSNSPDASTLKVEDTKTTGWTTILEYNLDTKNSTNDITLNHVVVGTQTGTANEHNVVSDVRLVVDGDSETNYTRTSGTNAKLATYNFDIDGNAVINAGDMIPVQVQVKIKQVSGNYQQGETLTATTTNVGYTADGAETLRISTDTTPDITGAATGEKQTLYSEGSILGVNDMITSVDSGLDSTTTDTKGVYTIKVDVTAFDTDLYVNKSGLRGTATTSSNEGALYSIMTGGVATTTGGTVTQDLSSDADTVGTQFVVREGQTKTFTLAVTYDPDYTGFYQVRLNGLVYAKDQSSSPTYVLQAANPESDFTTDSVSITN